MPEKPGLGPVQHAPVHRDTSTESIKGKEGKLDRHKVAKYTPEVLLKGFLKKMAFTPKPLTKYKVTVPPEQSKLPELPRATKAKGVLPEYMDGKVKAAPSLNNVEKQKLLGKGAFGEVHQVTNKANPGEIGETPTKLQKQYVVKDQKLRGSSPQEVRYREDMARKEVGIQREVAGTPKINQEEVRQGHHRAMMEHGGKALTHLMDADGDPSLSKSSAVPIDQAKDIAKQLCDQMMKAHEGGIIHRDIKPDNILINHKGQVTVADFGLAEKQTFQAGQFQGIAGSPSYMAPEVLTQPSYDTKADVWSMGVTLAEMMTGVKANMVDRAPNNQGFQPNHRKINAYRIMIHRHPSLPRDAKNLLLSMLQPDPQKRISFAETTTHPLFAKPAKLADQSYSQLQTVHRTTFQTLAKREQQLEQVEAIHKQNPTPESKALQADLKIEVTLLGNRLKQVQDQIRIKELKSQARSLTSEIKKNGREMAELKARKSLFGGKKRQAQSLDQTRERLSNSLKGVHEEIKSIQINSVPVPKPRTKR